jgi:hypothetical protein
MPICFKTTDLFYSSQIFSLQMLIDLWSLLCAILGGFLNFSLLTKIPKFTFSIHNSVKPKHGIRSRTRSAHRRLPPLLLLRALVAASSKHGLCCTVLELRNAIAAISDGGACRNAWSRAGTNQLPASVLSRTPDRAPELTSCQRPCWAAALPQPFSVTSSRSYRPPPACCCAKVAGR